MKSKPEAASQGRDWTPTLDDAVIQEYIRERVGEEGIPVARLIESKQPIQGVDIIETIKDKPANVRKILYRMEDARVAEYQKDTDKTGWETFLWRLTLHEVKHQINKERKKILDDLREKQRLEQENSFYICDEGHQRIIFEEAVKIEFKCPECHQPMNFIDNKARLREIEAVIQELEQLVFD